MPVLNATSKEPIYTTSGLVNPRRTSLGTLVHTGPIYLDDVIEVAVNPTSKTKSDPYALCIYLKSHKGWIRLARLVPGEDYHLLVARWPRYKWPSGCEDWPGIAGGNLCQNGV